MISCTRSLTAILIGLAAAVPAAAQRQLPSVVQLPSFQVFSYSGSVMVPDSGTAYLGGNKSSSSRYRRRGLNRSSGFSQGNSQASVTATIIDHDEIDRQLLGGSKKEFLDSDRGKVDRRQLSDVAAKRPGPTEEGKALVRHARKQYLSGNKAASFDTYRMAIGVLDGRLQELATVEFRRVFGTAADQSLRMASRRR